MGEAGPTVGDADVVKQFFDLAGGDDFPDLAFDGGKAQFGLFDSRTGRATRMQPHLAGIDVGKEIFANQTRETLQVTLRGSLAQHLREMLRYYAARVVKSSPRLETGVRAGAARLRRSVVARMQRVTPQKRSHRLAGVAALIAVAIAATVAAVLFGPGLWP